MGKNKYKKYKDQVQQVKDQVQQQGQQQVQNQVQQQTENVVKNTTKKRTQYLTESGFDKFKKNVKEQGSKLWKDPKGRIKELWKNNPKAAKWTAGAGGAVAGTLAVSGGMKAYQHYKDKKKENEVRNQVNGKTK